MVVHITVTISTEIIIMWQSLLPPPLALRHTCLLGLGVGMATTSSAHALDWSRTPTAHTTHGGPSILKPAMDSVVTAEMMWPVRTGLPTPFSGGHPLDRAGSQLHSHF